MPYFLRPTKLIWSRKENLRGGTKTPGLDLLANAIDGPERPTPLHLKPTKTATHLAHARSRSVRIGVVRFEKYLVAILSAKRQLSVAKLSAKRIFSLAKRDFLVANGRMAADFSSPEIRTSSLAPQNMRSSAPDLTVQAHRSYCIVTGLHDYLQGHRDYTSCGCARGTQSSGYICPRHCWP